MDTQSLKAEERKIVGRKVKKLREEGFLPANVYGKKITSLSIQIDRKEFEKIFKETGETGIIEISIGSKKRPVLVHNIQKDPVSDAPIHIDFVQVDLKEKITARVPVELVGESSTEKQGIGTIVQYVDEVEVEALPTDLPDSFEIDITGLVEVDQAVQVADIKVDRNKVQINEEPDRIIVKVEAPQEEEVVLPAAAEGEEGVAETVPEESTTEEVSSNEEQA